MKAIREQIPLGAHESFCAYRYQGDEFDAPYHFHPEVELVYIEEGMGVRIVGDNTALFSPGDLCLFGSNLPHVYHADQSALKASSLVVQFVPELLAPILSTPEMAPVGRLLQRSERGIAFPGKAASREEPRMRAIIDSSGPSRMVSLLQLLADLAAEKGARPLANLGFSCVRDTAQQARIETAWSILLNRFNENLSQAIVARELNMSPSSFSRLFRRSTNLTFTEALIEIRLGHACRQLMENDTNISEACFRSGFSNLSNFNRQFKKRYKVSPREWRLRLG